MRNYYPSWVYSANIDVTRARKAAYDKEYSKYEKAVDEAEKAAGRHLNLRERNEISKQFNI